MRPTVGPTKFIIKKSIGPYEKLRTTAFALNRALLDCAKIIEWLHINISQFLAKAIKLNQLMTCYTILSS